MSPSLIGFSSQAHKFLSLAVKSCFSSSALIKQEKTEDFAIWVASKSNLASLGIFHGNKDVISPRYSINTVDVPYRGNPNLRAQRGTFTAVYRTAPQEPNDPVDGTTIEVAIQKIFEDTRDANIHKAIFKTDASFFSKITIPLTEVKPLLRILRANGYHSASIYPGFQSCTDAVREAIDLLD